jgi:hypothetical protein
MAEIRPQPQSPALGALARMLGAARDAAGRVRIDSQLLGQTSLADLLSLPGAAGLAEDVSYFGPAAMLRPGSGRTLQTFRLDPRVLDAADVALNVSPLGALAAKGAARAARPVARAAGEAVNRAMLTGEGPLATALAPVAPRQLIVYHGTPHRFEPEEGAPMGRFRSEKIGTGEGAQVYGHGLYFAESPGVASSYKELAQRDPSRLTVDGNVVSTDSMYGRAVEDVARIGVKATLQKIDDNIRFNEKYAPDIASLYKSVRERIESLDPARVTLKQGSLYTVDLPDEAIARMLDWDKPLGKQPAAVRAAINKTRSMLPPTAIDDLGGDFSLLYGKDVTPNQFLNTWEALVGKTGAGEEALRNVGVPGVRYLDQGSRSTGTGTSNFVVFPGAEDMLTILERKAKGGPVRRYAEDVNKKPLTSGYYGVELRSNLYPGEDEFFRKNPTVAGMASDDNRVILNPYSTLSGREKEAVIMNEAARVHMRRNLDKPKFSLTPEQQARFANYSQNPDDVRATVAARILSGDPSAGKATPEQMEYVQRLRNLMVSEEQRLKHDERSKTVDDERQQGFIRGGMARRYAEGGAVNAAQYDPADIARRAASLMEEIDAA